MNNNILFVGDCHGKIKDFTKIVNKNKDSILIQVGDYGLGFINIPILNNVKFLRGNHDNPLLCRNHPNYLGEYGFNEELGFYFLGGAWSIDHAHRTVGIDIWEDEEINYSELKKAIEDYANIKPDVLVTHDCPLSFYGDKFLGKNIIYPSQTALALDKMIELHKPKIIIHGHHHVDLMKQVDGMTVICLNELSTIRLKNNILGEINE